MAHCVCGQVSAGGGAAWRECADDQGLCEQPRLPADGCTGGWGQRRCGGRTALGGDGDGEWAAGGPGRACCVWTRAGTGQGERRRKQCAWARSAPRSINQRLGCRGLAHCIALVVQDHDRSSTGGPRAAWDAGQGRQLAVPGCRRCISDHAQAAGAASARAQRPRRAAAVRPGLRCLLVCLCIGERGEGGDAGRGAKWGQGRACARVPQCSSDGCAPQRMVGMLTAAWMASASWARHSEVIVLSCV
jgi:hypothetical protein